MPTTSGTAAVPGPEETVSATAAAVVHLGPGGRVLAEHRPRRSLGVARAGDVADLEAGVLERLGRLGLRLAGHVRHGAAAEEDDDRREHADRENREDGDDDPSARCPAHVIPGRIIVAPGWHGLTDR